jgi:hypothetical protein
MNWTVVYLPSAEDELAELWLRSSDRTTFSSAANAIERKLRSDPLKGGEQLTSLTRVIIQRPVAMLYDVSDADRLVTVWAVLKSG